MDIKTPTLPTLPKIKSAWKMALWMAALNISYALIMTSFSALMGKISMWKMKRQMKKMQTEMMENMPTEGSTEAEEVTANA